MKEKILKWSIVLSGLVASGTAFAGNRLAAITKKSFPWRGPGEEYTAQEMYDLLGNIADFLFTIAGILLGIIIIWSGITYATAGADPTKATKAKSIFKNGLIAGVIIFAVGIILRTIEEFAKNPNDFFL